MKKTVIKKSQNVTPETFKNKIVKREIESQKINLIGNYEKSIQNKIGNIFTLAGPYPEANILEWQKYLDINSNYIGVEFDKKTFEYMCTGFKNCIPQIKCNVYPTNAEIENILNPFICEYSVVESLSENKISFIDLDYCKTYKCVHETNLDTSIKNLLIGDYLDKKSFWLSFSFTLRSGKLSKDHKLSKVKPKDRPKNWFRNETENYVDNFINSLNTKKTYKKVDKVWSRTYKDGVHAAPMLSLLYHFTN